MTSPTDWQALKELFLSVRALTPEARDAHLAAHCVDPDLRAEVLELLAHDAAGEGFLEGETPRVEVGPDSRAEPVRLEAPVDASRAPPRIPPFRIQEVLGQGGMGTVYLAEQLEPLHRLVAIKVLRSERPSAEVLARFESERQALARLSHPHIAQVFGAGTTDDGLPYLVMEYVPGDAVTHFCDERGLGVRERLALFATICRAVHHCHQRGLIHRDVKPSNLLVSELDGAACPKIIDFGVAKAIEPGPDEPRATRHGQVLGTPEYASPEQIAGDVDIDTRSDVYSLGVVLHELLTGELPVRAPADGRVSGRTTTRLRRDLDRVVVTALATDRDERYGSPAELADDVQRHLRGEPVTAGSTSLADRTRKAVRRHRLALTLAGVLLVGAGLGLLGLWRGLERALVAEQEARDAELAARRSLDAARAAEADARRAERDAQDAAVVARLAEDRALDSEAEARAAELLALASASQARSDAESADAMVDFLIELFEAAGPSERPIGSVTAAEILDRATARIDTDFAEDPRARARLLGAMSGVHQRLARLDVALDLRRRALDLWSALPEVDAMRIVGERRRLASVLERAGRHDELRTQLDAAAAGLVDDHPAAREEAARMARLRGESARDTGDLDGSARWLETALELAPRERPELRALVLSSLGQTRMRQSRYAEAERAYSEALAAYESTAPEGHHVVDELRGQLGEALSRLGQHDQARVHLESALAGLTRSVGEHVALTPVLAALAQLEQRAGALDVAAAHLERLRNILDATHEPLHADQLTVLGMFARLELDRGHPERALELHDEAVELFEQHVGADDVDTLGLRMNRALVLRMLGRDEQALAAFTDLLEDGRRALGLRHQITLTALGNRGGLLLEAGRADACIALYDELVETIVAEPDAPLTQVTLAMALSQRAAARLAAERPDEAREDALMARELAAGRRHPLALQALMAATQVLAEVGESG